jgi:hypothetical protein
MRRSVIVGLATGLLPAGLVGAGAEEGPPGLAFYYKSAPLPPGGADTTVFPAKSDPLAGQICAGGNAVARGPLPGADHDGAMTEGAAMAQSFLADRFAGAPFASDRDALPSAAPP